MAEFGERRWVTPDGLALYARDYPAEGRPAGLPVLCLHGFTRNSADFAELAPIIAAGGRRVIAMDIRGRGHSDRDPNPANYHPRVYVRDVLGFLGSLGIARAVFLGTSMGGIITMTLALARPQAVAGAILNDVGPAVDPAGLARITSYAGKASSVTNWEEAVSYCRSVYELAWPHYQAADWERIARRTFRDDPSGPVLDYDPAISSAAKAPGRITTLVAWLAFRRLAAKAPTLLIRGEHSDILSASIAERMRRRAPRLQVVEVSGVGHAPTLAEPEALAAIQAFLARVP